MKQLHLKRSCVVVFICLLCAALFIQLAMAENDFKDKYVFKSNKDTFLTCKDQGFIEAKATTPREWEFWKKGPANGGIHIVSVWHERYFLADNLNGNRLQCLESVAPNDPRAIWIEEGGKLKNKHSNRYLAIDNNYALTMSSDAKPECSWACIQNHCCPVNL
jgi:hypothetical protein